MHEFTRYWRVPLLVFIVINVFDRLSKWWIETNLGPVVGTSMPILPPWLYLTYIHNTGVAFGLFQGVPHFFTIIIIVISIGALYLYRTQMPHTTVVQLCVGGIVGGAVGNIIDRIRQGYVTDFVHVTWFPGIFNVADSAITVSVIALVIATWYYETRESPRDA
ncbi:MAG: signal peptidase II [Roseiflexaceae bacterium]|jgi:signal peptidase II